MKNIIIYLVILVAAMCGATSCSKHKTLSDKELALIFHDAFLTNAYTISKGLNTDTLRMYEPIFNKYGYTTEDVQYSIGNFSMRKSARLSDVVEVAINMLEAEGEVLDHEVAVLDTLDNISVRRMTEIIYTDSIIDLKSMRDTTLTKIRIEGMKKGEYRIDMRYRIDSLNKVTGFELTQWTEHQPNDTTKVERLNERSTRLLNYGGVNPLKSNLEVENDGDCLVINLARPLKASGVPNLRIRDVVISRVPTKAEARKMIYNEFVPVRIFDDKLLFDGTTNSL